jgi:predicted MPP superfamily phosphohydrolase
MKLYTIVYLILLTIIFVADYLLYKNALKRIFTTKLFLFVPGVLFAGFFTFLKLFSEQITDYRFLIVVMWINLVFLAIYISKLLFIVITYTSKKLKWNKKTTKLTSYILILSYLAIIIYGSMVAPDKIETTKTIIRSESLPAAFNNYTIVQISDIHLGSRYNGTAFYQRVIDSINAINPDMVVFTGDMVNNFADETKGYEQIFRQLKARDGKYAVLGNHDYGDYSEWESDTEKAKNFTGIKSAIQNFGFKLLLNEHCTLTKNGDSIILIGVENYHNKAYKNYAKLSLATKGLNASTFKILLSHNPNHWENEVLKNPFPIEITLAGHTHAGQTGIKIGDNVYSPVWFLYKLYQGKYEEKNQYLHVSRGLGYIGLPLIIGLEPEISVIKLKSK